MKIGRFFCLFVITLLLLCSACAFAGENKTKGSLNDLDGRPFGMLVGVPDWDLRVKERFKHSSVIYYNTVADLVLALKAGKIDAFVIDEPIIHCIMADDPQLTYFPEALQRDNYAFILPGGHSGLAKKFNVIMDRLTKDGTISRLKEKWFSKDYKQASSVPYSKTGNKGTMIFLTDSENPPLSFYRNETTVGLEVDIAAMIFAEMGYGMEIRTQEYSTIVPSLIAGKGDIGGAMFTITSERDKQVVFSLPYYTGGSVVAVRADDKDKIGLWDKMKDSFVSTFIVEDRWQLLLSGLGTTIIISVFSVLCGTAIGTLVCAMKRSRGVLLSLARGYICVMQGTPVLVLLMILYFVVFSSRNVNALPVAILAFSLNFAAYVAEMLYSSIEAVDKGQIEAAKASGFDTFQYYRYVILPQAVRYMLPLYRGEVISLIKMTSIVGYITVLDLTRMSDLIRSRTFEPFFPLITTALVYLLISALIIRFMEYLQRRVDPHTRRRVIKGVRMHDQH